MNATMAIINVLRAVGADPIATSTTGGTVIRVNAPIINKEDPHK